MKGKQFHPGMKSMSKATSVFLVSTYQNITALSRRKKGLLLTSLNIMLSSVAVLLQMQSILLLQLYMQHKQQAAFLHSLVIEANATLKRRKQHGLRTLCRKRQRWVNPGRTAAWWDNLMNGELPEREWKDNLRMSRSRKDFMALVNKLRPYLSPDSESFIKDTISIEKKVAMTLYYLKDQGSLRMTANVFGIAKSTLSVTPHRVCKAINLVLGPDLIKFPSTKEEIEHVTAAFKAKFGFPQLIGCIGGTHISIKQPNENPHNYFCYKMKYSLNVQAICDEKELFTDVDISWRGSLQDARVFANSGVNKKFQEKLLPGVYRELIPGHFPVSQVLLGDPAYPLLPNLMKDYTYCSSDEQVVFNQMLRSARNQIECAYGRLKARWRILNRPMDVKIDQVPLVVFASFVLNNYCELRGAYINEEAASTQTVTERRDQNCEHLTVYDRMYTYNSARGSMTRDTFTTYFAEYM